jgi:hypothetical protein
MGEHQQSRLLAKIAKKYGYSSSKHTGFLVALLVEIVKKDLTRQVEIKEEPVPVLHYISNYSKAIGLQMPWKKKKLLCNPSF